MQIENKLSTFDLRRTYRIFLAEVQGKEMVLLNYLRFGFIKGPSVSSYHGFSIVRAAELLEKKMTMESNRFRELLRFSVLENDILYAEIEPDNNILELLGPHYSDRYKNNPFIIHDIKRDRALIAAVESGIYRRLQKTICPDITQMNLIFADFGKITLKR